MKVRKNIYIDEDVIVQFDVMRAHNRKEFHGGFSAYVEKLVRQDIAKRPGSEPSPAHDESAI